MIETYPAYNVSTVSKPFHYHKVDGPVGQGVVYTTRDKIEAQRVADLLNRLRAEIVFELREQASYQVNALQDEVRSLEGELSGALSVIANLEEQLKQAKKS